MPVAASAASPDGSRDGQPAPLKGLVLVSTPIGNLGDLSARARSVLEACDLILCEDTRRTGRLMAAMDISGRTETLHEHNEDARIESVLERLRADQTIALVSDAGTPLVSDPGYRLVRAAIEADLPVTAVPGPNAAVTALDFVRVAAVAFHVSWVSACEASSAARQRSAVCGRPSVLGCPQPLFGTRRPIGCSKR